MISESRMAPSTWKVFVSGKVLAYINQNCVNKNIGQIIEKKEKAEKRVVYTWIWFVPSVIPQTFGK